jgi:hypothetical protein
VYPDRLCPSAPDTTRVRSGSQTTTSASLPTAIVPLFGKRPNSLAAFVEVASTKRSIEMRPVATPRAQRSGMSVSRSDMPGRAVSIVSVGSSFWSSGQAA